MDIVGNVATPESPEDGTKKRKADSDNEPPKKKKETEDSRFTKQQKDLLRKTWKGLWNTDVKFKFSVTLFKNLFTAHPELRPLFQSLKEIDDLDELLKSPKLKAHAISVVSAINSLVENLDNPDGFVGMLKKLARSHKRYNVTKANFEQLGPILLMTMQEYLLEEFTPTAKGTWLAAYIFIVETVVGEYQIMDKESKERSNGNNNNI